ncbi:MAG: inner membrane-spanning protein YciB [Bacteriovoracia bacterium]
MRNAQKPYFLLSFLPALAYWYLETYYTLEVALIGGVLLGIVEMLLEKKFTGHIHTLSKLNIGLIVILGGVSLIAKEGLFFKLQPTFTGVALALFLLFKKFRKQSLMVEMIKDMKQRPPLPEEFYKIMEWHICLFLMAFAAFMAWIAVFQTTSTWLFWKTAGFYIVFFVFMAFEVIYLRWLIRRMKR